MKNEEREPRKRPLARYLRYYHVGFAFFAAVGLFTWGGIKLDELLGTEVLFTLLGLAIGFGGGLRYLYTEVYGSGDKRASADRRKEGDADRERSS